MSTFHLSGQGRMALVMALAYSAIVRCFTEFQAALGSYLEFEAPVVIPAGNDFSVEFLAVVTESSTIRMFCGDTTSDHYIHINSDNSITFRVNGVPIRSAANIFQDGKLYRIRLARVAGAIFGYVNGVQVADGVSNGQFIIRRVGSAFSGFYFEGIISDLLVINNGFTVVDAPLDGVDSVTEELNNADPLNNLTRVNIPVDAVEQFSEVDGNWLGEELFSVATPLNAQVVDLGDSYQLGPASSDWNGTLRAGVGLIGGGRRYLVSTKGILGGNANARMKLGGDNSIGGGAIEHDATSVVLTAASWNDYIAVVPSPFTANDSTVTVPHDFASVRRYLEAT